MRETNAAMGRLLKSLINMYENAINVNHQIKKKKGIKKIEL